MSFGEKSGNQNDHAVRHAFRTSISETRGRSENLRGTDSLSRPSPPHHAQPRKTARDGDPGSGLMWLSHANPALARWAKYFRASGAGVSLSAPCHGLMNNPRYGAERGLHQLWNCSNTLLWFQTYQPKLASHQPGYLSFSKLPAASSTASA